MKLYNLTKKQTILADKIWLIQSQEALNKFMCSAPESQIPEIKAIVSLMMVTSMDEVEDTTVASLMLTSIGVSL